MSGTTQTLRNLLQLNYQPGITRQFNDDFPNLRYIRQNSRSVTTEGDEAVFAIETGLNEGGGFHGESADVALSGTPTHRLHRLRLKQMTFRLTISLKLMRKARTNAGRDSCGLIVLLPPRERGPCRGKALRHRGGDRRGARRRAGAAGAASGRRSAAWR
jgi:hypothetical protein